MRANAASFEEYVIEFEIALDLVCARCAASRAATDDIREDEQECPYGKWAERHATEARQAGWFLNSLSYDPDVPRCLCPTCARSLGIICTDEK